MVSRQSSFSAPAPDLSATASPPPQHSYLIGRSNQNYVNVVSFGFVASAILISMFLIMAIFERLLRPRATLQPILSVSERDSDHVAMLPVRSQLTSRIPKSEPAVNSNPEALGIPVLMPGQDSPSFIARPAPIPELPRNHSVTTMLGRSHLGSSSSSTSV